MEIPNSALISIEDIDQSFLPKGKFDAADSTHIDLVIEKFRKDAGADGIFTDVHFDGNVVQITQNKNAESELQKCIELLDLGGYNPAINRLEILLKQYPYQIHLLFNLGMALREVERNVESAALLSQATEISPGHAHAWTALAVSLQSENQNDAAIAAAKKAYNITKTDLYVLRTLGTLLEINGDYSAASSFLESALKVAPKDPQANLMLGKIKSTSDSLAAKKHFHTVCESAPGTSFASLASELMDKL